MLFRSCLSKGITGGYLPLAAVMTTDRVYDAFYDEAATRGFLHSHSYTGNPLACRAALATLDIFAADRVIETNRATSSSITEAAAALARHPRVRNFRNTGMIWAFEVDAADAGFARNYHQAALGHGVLLRPIGSTVYFMPPYIITPEETAFLIAGALAALNDCLK